MQHSNTVHPSGGVIVWQPVVMAPSKRTAITNSTAIYVFSIASIILGILSIALQIAALVIFTTRIYNSVYFPADVVGHGIWCGCFYIVAGSLGVAACKRKTRSLLTGTVVMSSLSIAGSIVASTLSGIAAGEGLSYNCYSYDLCDAWLGLEWSLMSISILAFCSAIPLVVVASLPLCCGKRNQGSERNTTNVAIGNGHQPMYFQPPPMYVGAQLQQQPVAQFTYAGQQQTQQPHQILYPQLQQAQSLQPTPSLQVKDALQQPQPQFMQQAVVDPQPPQHVPSVQHQEKSE